MALARMRVAGALRDAGLHDAWALASRALRGAGPREADVSILASLGDAAPLHGLQRSRGGEVVLRAALASLALAGCAVVIVLLCRRARAQRRRHREAAAAARAAAAATAAAQPEGGAAAAPEVVQGAPPAE